MPRLLHVSDTHLGLQAYDRVTPQGRNQREVDFEDAFRRVVDAAVEHPPDVFLHAGDLFDHPRPNNRAIGFALEQVRRLDAAGIETVLVTGNHDAPRMRETGSIFRIFEGLRHVHPVYASGLESLDVGGVRVDAVPQAVTQSAFQAQLETLAPTGSLPRVLVVHGSVLGVEGLFTSEFNEYQIEPRFLSSEYDYVALGHFHNRKKVAPNAHYCGSPECCSFAEANQAKGFYWVDVERGSLALKEAPSGARVMRDVGTIDWDEYPGADGVDVAHQRLSTLKEGTIARVTFENLAREEARRIDWDEFRTRFPGLLHLDVRVRVREESHHAQSSSPTLGSVGTEFEDFLAKYPLKDGLREAVRREALECLAVEEASQREA